MAFAHTHTGNTIFGNKRKAWGTFTNGATDSGGAITTGLSAIDDYSLNITSHFNSTMPKCTVSTGTITIVTENGVDGVWTAYGL